MSGCVIDSGHKSEDIETQLEKLFEVHKEGSIRLQPDGWIFTKSFLQFANRINKYHVRLQATVDSIVLVYCFIMFV